jgi:hypothetical protein
VPIPSGALACIAWRYAPALRRGGGRSWTTARPGRAAWQPAAVADSGRRSL